MYAVLAALLPLFSACMANFGFFSSIDAPQTQSRPPEKPPEPNVSPYGAEIKVLPMVIYYNGAGAIRPDTDLEVKKRLPDGSWEDVPYNGGAGFSLSPDVLSSAGAQTITVTVKDYPEAGQDVPGTYKVYVAVSPQEIYSEEALLVLPAKIIYTNGESLVPASEVKVYRRDKFGVDLPLTYNTGFTLTPTGPFATAGAQTITVTGAGSYRGLSPVTYSIWVKPGPVQKKLIAVPAQVNYPVGGTINKTTDLTVFKQEADGAVTQIAASAFTVTSGGVDVSAVAFTAAGEKTITAGGVSGYADAEYKVWVSTPPTSQGPEVMVIPKKTTYSTPGDAVLNKDTHLEVYRRQADGAMVKLAPADFTASPPVFTTSGQQSVTVSGISGYSGSAPKYTVWVDATPQPRPSAELLVIPAKALFAAGDIFTATCVTVYRWETDQSMTLLTYKTSAPGADEYTISGVTVGSALTTGEPTVIIEDDGTAAGKTYKIRVEAIPQTYTEALIIAPAKVFYTVGESIDTAAPDLRVFKQNTSGAVTELSPGSGYTLTHNGAVPSGAFTGADAGERTVTVTGGALTETYTVMVAPAPALILSPQKTAYSLAGTGENIFKPVDHVTVNTSGLITPGTLTYTITGPAPASTVVAADKAWNAEQALTAEGTYTITVKMTTGAAPLTASYTVTVSDTSLGSAIIVYKANGGAGADKMEYFEVSAVHSLVNVFTRANCTFKGWAGSRAGAVVYGGPGDSGTIPAGTYTPGAIVHLYAKWNIDSGKHGDVVAAAKTGNAITLTGVDWDTSLQTELQNVLAVFTASGTLDIGGVGGSITTWSDNSPSGWNNKVKTLILPDVTTSLGSGVFSLTRYPNLESVSGAGVTTVGNNAFILPANTTLKTVNFPEATTIGTDAFNGCTGLTSVSFPKVTTISQNAFRGCNSLATVNFPEVTSLGNTVFSSCAGLTTVNLPKVTILSDGTFFACTSLIFASLPLVEDIGPNAFEGCANLINVYAPEVTEIKEHAFADCTNLASAVFRKVTVINIGAFRNCTGLTSVDFPVVTRLGVDSTSSSPFPDVGAFLNCTALSTAAFPLATEVGHETFSGCTSLTTVRLESVSRFAQKTTGVPAGKAFSGCTKLRTLYLPSAPPAVDVAGDLFTATGGGTSPRIDIIVGSAPAVTAYTGAAAWGNASAGAEPGLYGTGHNTIVIVP
jgi:hypothetical protein